MKFNTLIQRRAKNYGVTTGEALLGLLKLADSTPYTDWRVEDLDTVASNLIECWGKSEVFL